MTERNGKISRVHPSTGAVTLVHTIADVVPNGEGGLLGMALHPEFPAVPFLYVSYNYGSYQEKIVRFTWSSGTLQDPFILLDQIGASGIHNGSRLLIHENKLFITTGDASNTTLPQNLQSLNGKVLRINLNGSIPADNPFPNSAVWTYGHRNPQGLVLAGNRLFISEHGPSTDDEINLIQKGRNYGWPNVHGFCNDPQELSFCTANNVVTPLKAWTPTAATCGLDYYQSDLIPQWKNSLLMATLKNSRLYQMKLNNDKDAIVETTEYFTNQFGRLRDICMSPEGKVYICTSNGGNDKIIVVEKN
jgi:glucose/arabinose dehydrogenase